MSLYRVAGLSGNVYLFECCDEQPQPVAGQVYKTNFWVAMHPAMTPQGPSYMPELGYGPMEIVVSEWSVAQKAMEQMLVQLKAAAAGIVVPQGRVDGVKRN